ncbi:prepilin-type N-terminal cleavage/methylation domain-containing protein [Pseudomonas knackmussii]|uniref:Prepilin-type N-terminal cleavage/methylation domain-containing protein n=1 Tax=Pseudomonas knackmussii TaxID=65741 RepID=A0ABY4KTM9_9PSED|nr:prepilin-type N-terminal cleavage/methylation domain-containing protein [Pseudomonas knackmussii]UPQ84207.1 prepilin-type N-terminal cleavage/methylation domain-containing protein [Pseudomonas knackmussii]
MIRPQRGMTLVELVITIVIIGIAAAALFSAMASITARSADPMLRQQSVYIAQAYLEEILRQSYSPITPGDCDNRSCFEDVRAYDGLATEKPYDVKNVNIDGLDGYAVRVEAKEIKNGLNGIDAIQVSVTVTDPSSKELQLVGWRTCYGEDACP